MNENSQREYQIRIIEVSKQEILVQLENEGILVPLSIKYFDGSLRSWKEVPQEIPLKL
jgi:hypothetical protein